MNTTHAVLPPFAGRTVEVVYDGLGAINDYDADGRTVRYAITAGPLRGARGEATYQWREIADGIYAISWQEADGASVVHVDDFARGTSLSFFTTPDLALYRLAGTLRPVDAYRAGHGRRTSWTGAPSARVGSGTSRVAARDAAPGGTAAVRAAARQPRALAPLPGTR